MTQRKPVDLGGLDDFEPRSPKENRGDRRQEVEEASAWPSREAPPKIVQLGVRGDQRILERFKRMCEDNGRRTYVEMLEILMDNFKK